MPVSVTWDDVGRRIARMTVDNEWTWDELQQAQQSFHQMLAQGDHPVGLIIELPYDMIIPANKQLHLCETLEEARETIERRLRGAAQHA